MYGKIHDLKCSSLANYFKKGTLEFNYTRFKQTIPLTKVRHFAIEVITVKPPRKGHFGK